MYKMQRKIQAVILAVLISVPALAQSAAEIEMAKQMARQNGYSEAQIEAMMKQQGKTGAGGTGKATAVPVIDRNASQQKQTTGMMQENAYMFTELTELGKRTDVDVKARIFGHDIFKNTNLNFVPNYNIATPEHYKLAPGDEVIIDIWGNVLTNITATITPEGAINIPELGPVYIAGQTVVGAEKSLKEYLSKIYSGISDPTPNTFVKVGLGKIRSLTVNVVGDVQVPGTYTLPSLSTIASALYLAGGPSNIGTVREIQLYRKNKLVSTFDIYEFITKGTFDTNVRLEDNDVVVVGPYAGIVTLDGGVKRPMKYEIKPKETLDKLLAYAGGFADDAYISKVHVERIRSTADKSGPVAQAFDVTKEQFATFQVAGGDVITVLQQDKRLENGVKIAGAVWRPGSYSISEAASGAGVSTLRQLIAAAGGVKEEAYLSKAYVVRYGPNRTKEQVSFSLENVILGKEDVKLFPDDSVQIFHIDSLTPKQIVKIFGEVNAPDAIANGAEYEYRKGVTIGDLILKAGGLTKAATLTNVEIARRVFNPDGDIRKNDTVALVIKYDLLKNPALSDTQLEPFDIVFIRKSASYKPQQAIYVDGEANYTGWHVIEKNTVRLSDVLAKAQGITRDAYIKGAKLSRKLTKEEFERLKTAMEIARKQVSDTTALDSLEIGDRYDIAIDLEEALANPGSYADVILRENDHVMIPKLNNTVRISGAVLYPNTISYNPKYNWRNYLTNAGGTLRTAMTGKIYMVHMNGSVATKGSKAFKVLPGTEIVVPAKDKRPNSGQTLASILGIASSTASLAAMVVTIVNQVK